MKIEKVEALHLRLSQVEQKADGSQEVLIARVTTDTGLVGHGEAVSNAHVARAIIEAPRSAPFRWGLAAAIEGRDPMNPEARWADMFEASRWYGRRGAVMHAIAALDTALWDIVGQANFKPCHAMWGTRRERVRAYASVLFPQTAAEARPIVEDIVGRGFTAIKFGWGPFGHDRDHDIAMLTAIRAVAGDSVDIMVDAGRIWSAGEAVRRAPELFDRFNILWLEEPLHEDDLEGYRRLAATSPGRIAAGETEETSAQFETLIDCGVRVIQPDVGRAGGLTVCRALSGHVAGSNVWCIPHCFGSGVNLAASLQWTASAPDAPFNEYPLTASPLRNDLVSGAPDMEDGYVVVGNAPGLGITLNEDVVARYRVA